MNKEPFFLPYQRRWLEDRSPRRLMVKSRQIGMSMTAAYDLVRKVAPASNRLDAWVSSRDEFQARLFGEDCLAWVRHLQTKSPDHLIFHPGRKPTSQVIHFANGRGIYCLSSNPDAQAGKRGRRLFDEFALNPDNRQLYSIGYPGTLWGGGLDIVSTHRGSANFFNDLVIEARHKGNPKGFSLHCVNIEQAVAEGLLDRLKAKWRLINPDDPRLAFGPDDLLQSLRDACPDEETWQQEFMCNPAEDETAFLSYDLIASCEYPPGEAWETAVDQSTNDLCLGVDIGREQDLTVFWLVEKMGDVAFTRKVLVMARESFDAQEAALEDFLRLPQLRRAAIDQTGLGRQFAERAQKRYGEARIEPVTFTAARKEQLAYMVRAAFEQRTLRLPHDPKIRADLRSIRKEQTLTGALRFNAARGRDGHADRFWALALALQAASTTLPRFEYSTVPRPGFRFEKLGRGALL